MNISNLTDSELIAELYERQKEPEVSKLEQLLADYNDRIDMIIDDCCDDLDELKEEFYSVYRFDKHGGLARLGDLQSGRGIQAISAAAQSAAFNSLSGLGGLGGIAGSIGLAATGSLRGGC